MTDKGNGKVNSESLGSYIALMTWDSHLFVTSDQNRCNNI